MRAASTMNSSISPSASSTTSVATEPAAGMEKSWTVSRPAAISTSGSETVGRPDLTKRSS